MPPKIRELMQQLKRSGFTERSAKGSHRIFCHPSGVLVTISGKPGNDAKPYQISQVNAAIEKCHDEKN